MRFAPPRHPAVRVLVAGALLLSLTLAAGPLVPAKAGEAGAQAGLFGTSEKPSQDLSQFPKWTEMLAQYERERALELQPCSGNGCALQRWRKFVDSLRGKDPLQQLEAVNRYVNQTPYQTDLARYGVVDHWATPREFFGRSGDCEDYAIAKYLSLRQLGWSTEALRVLVLNDEARRELHAVLIVYAGGTAYVLDNLSPAVRPHTAIQHYRPIFSINETAWFFHQGWSPSPIAPVATPAVPPTVSVGTLGAVSGARPLSMQASATIAVVDSGQYGR